MLKSLPQAQIRLDGGTQPRAEIDWEYVGDLVDVLRSGVPFADPLEVFFDGEDYWLADGFHRWHAHTSSDAGDPVCNVREGTLSDAQWFACQANRGHGLRRTNADKRGAVLAALAHPQGKDLTDRALADYCGVSHTFVAKVRDEDRFDDDDSVGNRCQLPDSTTAGDDPPPVTRKGKDGKQYKAKKPKKLKPAAEIVDQLGNVVPPAQQAAFSIGATQLRQAQAAIQQIRKDVKACCTGPAGRFLSASQMDTDLRNAWVALKHGLPYAIVPPTAKHKRWACGWMNRTDYDNLPPEQKHKGS